jgi:hypothetical protein
LHTCKYLYILTIVMFKYAINEILNTTKFLINHNPFLTRPERQLFEVAILNRATHVARYTSVRKIRLTEFYSPVGKYN